MGAFICGVTVGSLCPPATDPNTVNVLFTDAALKTTATSTPSLPDNASTLTLATVASLGTAGTSAVTTTSGAFNTAGGVPIGTAGTTVLTAGVTSAPDAVSFGTPRAATTGNSVIDITFNKPVFPQAGGGVSLVFASAVGTGEEGCTAPGPTSPVGTNLTVPSYSGSQITVLCPNGTALVSSGAISPSSQISFMVVQPGTVGTALPPGGIVNNYLDTTSVAHVSTAPFVHLTGVTLTPGTGTNLDTAQFNFDPVISSTVPTASMKMFGLVDSNGTGVPFNTTAAGCTNAPATTVAAGMVACQSSVGTATTTQSILFFLPNGTLGATSAVGGFVQAGAVSSASNAAIKNVDDELGAANSATSGQQPGVIAAPQLTKVTLATVSGGLGGSTTQVTYTFDSSVITTINVARLHAYDGDGTELTCQTGAAGTGAADNTVVCSSFIQGSGGGATVATSAQLSGIKLGTIDGGAVTGNSAGTTPVNAFPNPEGFANV
jgi:hypothetical protein